MILNKDKALKVAEYLLRIKAIKLRPEEPFNWASGWKSPIYCDNRQILAYPQIRTSIRQTFAEQITQQYPNAEVIVGVATGGIAIGALVAEEMGLPFIYVRSAAKEHGMGNQIEGFYTEGQNVVVIEDLISTGASSLRAVIALREANLKVLGLAAIFTYGFATSIQNFKEAKCEFFTLSNYDHMILHAAETEYVNESVLESLREWKQNPESWKQ
jgi:orotate phosphoribosyltransferase